jgi:hypothetical protein
MTTLCRKCGKLNGMTDREEVFCDCPRVPQTMVNDIYQAVLNNGTVNDGVDYIGVAVDLVKKGYKKS